jgi:predicted dehydrogenase
MTAPRPTRFALIGCGCITKPQIRALQDLQPKDGKLIYLCDTDEPWANALAQEFHLETSTFVGKKVALYPVNADNLDRLA